jgi:hypothetical protein
MEAQIVEMEARMVEMEGGTLAFYFSILNLWFFLLQVIEWGCKKILISRILKHKWDVTMAN